MADLGGGTIVVACDLTGVSDAQRARHDEVRALLRSKRREVRRGETTWTVTFERDVPIGALAEFVEFERRCCRFLSFDIRGRPGGVCLELGGPEGARELIAELFDIVSAPLAGAG